MTIPFLQRRPRPRPDTLAFRVAAETYTVHVTTRPIVHDGVDCDGLSESDGRRIRIAASVPSGRRYAVLIHELSHAWQFEFDPPSDTEGLARWVAAVAGSAARDLADQGGVAALERLVPTDADFDREGGDDA